MSFPLSWPLYLSFRVFIKTNFSQRARLSQNLSAPSARVKEIEDAIVRMLKRKKPPAHGNQIFLVIIRITNGPGRRPLIHELLHYLHFARSSCRNITKLPLHLSIVDAFPADVRVQAAASECCSSSKESSKLFLVMSARRYYNNRRVVIQGPHECREIACPLNATRLPIVELDESIVPEFC